MCNIGNALQFRTDNYARFSGMQSHINVTALYIVCCSSVWHVDTCRQIQMLGVSTENAKWVTINTDNIEQELLMY